MSILISETNIKYLMHFAKTMLNSSGRDCTAMISFEFSHSSPAYFTMSRLYFFQFLLVSVTDCRRILSCSMQRFYYSVTPPHTHANICRQSFLDSSMINVRKIYIFLSKIGERLISQYFEIPALLSLVTGNCSILW